MWDPSSPDAHEACIDWHLGPNPRVDYLVDGKIVATNTENVPTRMTQYNIAAAFPDWGTENSSDVSPFETLHMWVESVRIEPHTDEYGGAFQEVLPLYPNDGLLPVGATQRCTAEPGPAQEPAQEPALEPVPEFEPATSSSYDLRSNQLSYRSSAFLPITRS